MPGEDHRSMDDDPPTDGMCHLRLLNPVATTHRFKHLCGQNMKRRQPGGQWTEHGGVWRKRRKERCGDQGNNGRLITDSKEVLRICAVYVKELLNWKRSSKLP